MGLAEIRCPYNSQVRSRRIREHNSISVMAIFNALSSRRVRIRISALLRPRAIAQVAKSESTVGQGYLQNGGELFIGILYWACVGVILIN